MCYLSSQSAPWRAEFMLFHPLCLASAWHLVTSWSTFAVAAAVDMAAQSEGVSQRGKMIPPNDLPFPQTCSHTCPHSPMHLCCCLPDLGLCVLFSCSQCGCLWTLITGDWEGMKKWSWLRWSIMQR